MEMNFDEVSMPEQTTEIFDVISPLEKKLTDKHKDEIEKLRHEHELKNKKFFYGFARFSIFIIVVFLIMLFFMILPISQMDFNPLRFYGYTNDRQKMWSRVHEWANAFLATGSSFGMTLAALIVSDLIKKSYAFIKAYEKKIR